MCFPLLQNTVLLKCRNKTLPAEKHIYGNEETETLYVSVFATFEISAWQLHGNINRKCFHGPKKNSWKKSRSLKNAQSLFHNRKVNRSQRDKHEFYHHGSGIKIMVQYSCLSA